MKVVLNDKIWDKATVHELLDRSPDAVARALLTVYANQTADEQVSQETKHNNGVGFTGRDAQWLSDIAEKYRRWGRWASDRQLNAVRRSVKKYHRQILMQIAEQPGAEIVTGRQKSVSNDLTSQEQAEKGARAEEIMREVLSDEPYADAAYG